MTNKQSFSSMSDEEVVRIAKSGSGRSEYALEYIIRKFRPHAERKASNYFLAGAESQDLVQEGLIGLFKAVMDYSDDKEASFRSFADLCITRQILSAVKGASRKKHGPLNNYYSLSRPLYENEESETTLLDTLPDYTSPEPEEVVVSEDSRRRIDAKLAKALSPLERQVLSLYIRGMSYNEIGIFLSKEPKSIDNALQRIKKKAEKLFPPSEE